MMKTTDLWEPNHFTEFSRLNGSRLRCVQLERKMPPRSMVIPEVPIQHLPEMLLAEHDHVIEALAPDTPDDSFHVWVLPGAARRDHHLFDPEVPHAVPKPAPVDPITIPKQVRRSGIPRECLRDLARRPLRGRIRGDVEVKNSSSIRGQSAPTGSTSSSARGTSSVARRSPSPASR